MSQLDLYFHEKQKEIFFESKAKYKIIAKGRRFGFTRGLANFCILKSFEGVKSILWVDTIYSNIERYFDRYFYPHLKNLSKDIWKFRRTRSELKIKNCIIDFRSADKPENLEGFGYELIIINEAGIVLKNRNIWNESIRPMMLDFGADVIIGGTPKGKRIKRNNEEHLFYELYKKAESDGVVWRDFNYSSYDNPILCEADIKELEDDISPSLREQEIYGKFIDKTKKGMINPNWFGTFDQINEKVITRIQSWDTAFKTKEENDYSVCVTFALTKSGYYVFDVWRGRVEFPELKRKFIELNELHKPDKVLIEDKASGQSLIQEMERETRIPIVKIKVNADKIARGHSITPILETGRVKLLKDAYWVKGFLNECEDFPDGEFDDQFDAFCQGISYLKNMGVSENYKVTSKKSKLRREFEKFKYRI